MNIFKRTLIAAALFALIAAGVGLHTVLEPRIMVYMYHSISDEPFNPDAVEFSVMPDCFEKQLRYFSGSGFETIFATELPDADLNGKKKLVITFDDGYEDNYTRAFPLLKKYGCKATIFMIAGEIGKPGYLTADQIREMTESGLVSIQSHTVSHMPLAWGDKTYEDVVYEMSESKRIIEEAAGAPVTAIAIPNGNYDDMIIKIARDYYDVAFTGTDFIPYTGGDTMNIHRVGIYRRHSAGDVRRMTEQRPLYVLKRGVQKLLGME